MVSPDWLEKHLDDPEVIVMEVDERPGVYNLGHIPKAHQLDWRSELQDVITRDIPGPEAMRRLWRRVGLGPGVTAVFYGDMNNWYAAFAYWLFRVYGAPELRLLDGSRQVWLAEKRPLTVEVPGPADIDPVLEPRYRPKFRASWTETAEKAFSPGRLLDVRTEAEYRGEALTEPGHPDELAQRAGHIPGAISVPWDLAIDVDGFFRPDDELRQLFVAHGVDLDDELVTYCRIGERSAHTWFVISEMLGVPARNYDGSWSEWGSMVGMPIAVGEQPGEPQEPRRLRRARSKA